MRGGLIFQKEAERIEKLGKWANNIWKEVEKGIINQEDGTEEDIKNWFKSIQFFLF